MLAERLGVREGDARARTARVARRARATLGGRGGLAALDAGRGRVQRIHGDLHVAQFLRAGDGLVVVDWEGEPGLPLAERARPRPALRDLGSLRLSLAHAARAAHRRNPGFDWRALVGGRARRGAGCLRGARHVDRELLHALELEKELGRARRTRRAGCPSGSTLPRPCSRSSSRSGREGRRRSSATSSRRPSGSRPCLDAYAGRDRRFGDCRRRAAGRVHRDGELALRRPSRRGAPALARRRRRRGARLDRASRPRPAPDLLAVGISASGSTPETVEALARHRGTSLTVAVTNDPEARSRQRRRRRAAAPRRDRGGRRRLPHLPGDARRAPAPRGALTGGGPGVDELRPAVAPRPRSARAAARGSHELADRLAAAHTTYAIAPAERLSSALQSALMLREGPRLRGGRDGDGRLAPRRRLPLEAARATRRCSSPALASTTA